MFLTEMESRVTTPKEEDVGVPITTILQLHMSLLAHSQESRIVLMITLVKRLSVQQYIKILLTHITGILGCVSQKKNIHK